MRKSLKKEHLIKQLNVNKEIKQISGWSDLTKEQAAQHIDKNITDIASIKAELKKMAEMLVILRDAIL